MNPCFRRAPDGPEIEPAGQVADEGKVGAIRCPDRRAVDGGSLDEFYLLTVVDRENVDVLFGQAVIGLWLRWIRWERTVGDETAVLGDAWIALQPPAERF